MPGWLIDVVLGAVAGRLGSFPGWKLMYRAQWEIARREGSTQTMPRHLPGFAAVAWPSTLVGAGIAAWTGVPWWSLLSGLIVGGALAGLAWAGHLVSPRRVEDEFDPDQ